MIAQKKIRAIIIALLYSPLFAKKGYKKGNNCINLRNNCITMIAQKKKGYVSFEKIRAIMIAISIPSLRRRDTRRDNKRAIMIAVIMPYLQPKQGIINLRNNCITMIARKKIRAIIV